MKPLQRIKFILTLLFAIGFLVGIGFLLYIFFKTIISLQKEISAAIIAAITTIIVSLLTVLGAKYYERKSILERELRDKKIPIYESFIEFWFKLTNAEKITGKSLTENEIIKFMNSFTSNLIIWGSDEVVSKWSNFRLKLIKMGENIPPDFMFEFEGFLSIIRKDIGHKNQNIQKGILLGLFVNDIENYL